MEANQSSASPKQRAAGGNNNKKADKKANGSSSPGAAPVFKGSAATVKSTSKVAPASPTLSPAPCYVTSIKSSSSSSSKKGVATQKSSSAAASSTTIPAKKANKKASAKAAATVAASHAKAPKDLTFDATTLGTLDPAYVARVFKEGFISARGWDHLRTGYRYTGVDHSFCGNRFLYLWWNLVVERFVPLWVAPNLLTLLGFLCNFGAFLLSAYNTDNMQGAAPPYVWVIVGISIFAYQTFDSIDGRQARRTNTASPLGELFDHVCDSAICILFVLNMGCMLHLGPVWTWVLCWAILTPFYLCHWEEYYTGILEMGEFNGPVEAQLFAMLTCFFTAGASTYDPIFWAREAAYGFTRGQCFILFFYSIVLPTAATHVWKVASSLRDRKGLGKAFAQLFPLAWLGLMGTSWVWSAMHVFLIHPHTFLLAFGAAFAYITSRLIVQRMCHEPIRPFYTILVPLTFGALNSLVPYLTSHIIKPWVEEERMVAIFFVYAVGSFLFLCYSLTQQLCRYLKIRAFAIPYPTAASGARHAARPPAAATASRHTSL